MEPMTERSVTPEPDAVLRAGRGDAGALLTLWLVRRAFLTLLGAGLLVLALSGDLDAIGELEPAAITSVAEAREVAGSPQALLVLAPVTRLGSGWLALVLTYPHARRLQRHADSDTRRTGRHPAVWTDRWLLAKALRDWRWTSSVRRLARRRLGRAGPVILVVDLTLLVAGIVLLPVAMVALVRSVA